MYQDPQLMFDGLNQVELKVKRGLEEATGGAAAEWSSSQLNSDLTVSFFLSL